MSDTQAEYRTPAPAAPLVGRGGAVDSVGAQALRDDVRRKFREGTTRHQLAGNWFRLQEVLDQADAQAQELATERVHREKAEAALSESVEDSFMQDSIANSRMAQLEEDLATRNRWVAEAKTENVALSARLEEEKTGGAESEKEKLELVKGVKRIHSRLFHVTSKRDVLELARDLRIELGDLVAGFTEKNASPAPVQGEGEEGKGAQGA